MERGGEGEGVTAWDERGVVCTHVSELLEVIDAVLDRGRIGVVVLADALLWSQKLSLKHNETLQPEIERSGDMTKLDACFHRYLFPVVYYESM